MTHPCHLLMLAAGILLAGPCLADDAPSHAAPSRHQAMHECIEKQKTADVTMSKSQMTRLCKDELKRQKDLGESTPPPRDVTPNN